MGLWSLITQAFTHQDSYPELHIAILAPQSSGTIEKIINLTIQNIKANTRRMVTVTQFNHVTHEAQFSLFLTEAQANHFDLVFAITASAAAQAKKIYTEHGIFIPTLIMTYPEKVPHPLPNHISALLFANNAPFIFQLLTASIPKLKKLIICSNKPHFQLTQEIIDLRSLCAAHTIEILPVYLPQSSQELIQDLHTQIAFADALFMPADSEAFKAMPDVINLARQYSCPVITSELYAIKYGADIAFGYPPESLATECAQRLLYLLQHPKRDVSLIQSMQEVHCRNTAHSKLLRSMANRQVNYNFKIIGSRDSEESELSR